MGSKGTGRRRWIDDIVSWLVVGLVLGMGTLPSVDALQDDVVDDYKYIHLWASQDGETHIETCKMQNFTLQSYSDLPQYLRSDFGGLPTNLTFTQLPLGFTQGLHSPPSVQFVIDLKGQWYIQTTDGSEYVFGPGEVLFQDNTKNSPADKVPQHGSGNFGNVTSQQFIMQINRTAQVDVPCPF